MKTQESRKSGTSVKKCSCHYPEQDRIYGYNMRLYNYAPAKKEWRCTVCEKERK